MCLPTPSSRARTSRASISSGHSSVGIVHSLGSGWGTKATSGLGQVIGVSSPNLLSVKRFGSTELSMLYCHGCRLKKCSQYFNRTRGIEAAGSRSLCRRGWLQDLEYCQEAAPNMLSRPPGSALKGASQPTATSLPALAARQANSLILL